MKDFKINITNELTSYRANELRRGFTLIEVLLVMAIIGVLAVTITPYFGGTLSDANLEDTANAIIFDLKSAQSKAMNGINGAQWGVCFRNPSSGDDQYEVVSPPGSCTESTAANSTYIAFPANNVVFDAPAPGSATLVTFKRGSGATTGNRTITLNLNGQLRNINITSAGRIY